jgi:gamma-glutamyl-gamma-aminobutyrate hydrolase PuuD
MQTKLKDTNEVNEEMQPQKGKTYNYDLFCICHHTRKKPVLTVCRGCCEVNVLQFRSNFIRTLLQLILLIRSKH